MFTIRTALATVAAAALTVLPAAFATAAPADDVDVAWYCGFSLTDPSYPLVAVVDVEHNVGEDAPASYVADGDQGPVWYLLAGHSEPSAATCLDLRDAVPKSARPGVATPAPEPSAPPADDVAYAWYCAFSLRDAALPLVDRVKVEHNVGEDPVRSYVADGANGPVWFLLAGSGQPSVAECTALRDAVPPADRPALAAPEPTPTAATVPPARPTATTAPTPTATLPRPSTPRPASRPTAPAAQPTSQPTGRGVPAKTGAEEDVLLWPLALAGVALAGSAASFSWLRKR